MRVELISIGDELLIGQTINTNAAWMGEQLTKLGLIISRVVTIADSEEAILTQLVESEKNSDVILITGGLGPTKDDITKTTLCKYFDTKLVRNKKVEANIEEYFTSRGKEMLEVNRQQADLPESSTVLENSRGTAAGMLFRKSNKIFVSMPGVPYEMKGIMEDYIFDIIKEEFNLPYISNHVIMTQGIGESFLAEIIKDWEDSLKNKNIKLAYLPSPGIVKLRLTSIGKDKIEVEKNVLEKIKELNSLISKYIYSENGELIEHTVGELLLKNKLNVSTAESCTGGLIASKIVSKPGSSNYFSGSIVAYSNEIKEKQLDVDPFSLEEYGAVSKQVVEQMALGVKSKLDTDFAVATSGIAGPDGGTTEKPVGTVWVGIATPENVYSKKFMFGGDRERIIEQTVQYALNFLRLKIIDYIE